MEELLNELKSMTEDELNDFLSQLPEDEAIIIKEALSCENGNCEPDTEEKAPEIDELIKMVEEHIKDGKITKKELKELLGETEDLIMPQINPELLALLEEVKEPKNTLARTLSDLKF